MADELRYFGLGLELFALFITSTGIAYRWSRYSPDPLGRFATIGRCLDRLLPGRRHVRVITDTVSVSGGGTGEDQRDSDADGIARGALRCAQKPHRSS